MESNTTSKIHIACPTVKVGAGGNNFLRGLKRTLNRIQRYTDSPSEADVIIYNSHHETETVRAYRRQWPHKIFIHRLDGLFELYNRPGDQRQAAALAANALADASVFQSQWAYDQHCELANFENPYLIYNGVDEDVFFPEEGYRPRTPKTRLLNVSFSDNPNKGFKYLEYLAQKLDPDQWEISFIGKNEAGHPRINNYGLVSHDTLPQIYKEHDIFVTGTLNECCSNAILEALACGLPVLALNSGSNGELVGEAGDLFDGTEDIIPKLELMVRNLQKHKDAIKPRTIFSATTKYLELVQTLICQRYESV